jgi:transcriptional regulator with XRE-family HTH domain
LIREEEIIVENGKSKPGPKRWEPTPKQIKEVEGLAAQGLNQEQIAAVLGVSLSTITRRRRDSAEFHAVMDRGAHKGLAFVVNKLFERIKDDNLKAIMFFLSARGGGSWSQRPPNQTRVNSVQEEERLKAEAQNRDDEIVARIKGLTAEELQQLQQLSKKIYGKYPSGSRG